MYLESFLFAADVIMPVCLLVLVGAVLRRTGHIDEHFIHVSSSLVFKLTLPALVFLAISSMTFDPIGHSKLMLFVAVAILASCFLSVVWARLVGVGECDASAFVQASFRSNLGIVGIALAVYAFGEEGTEVGALVLAVGVPMYNLLSVIVLARGHDVSFSKQLLLIARNPLIVAILCAVIVSVFQWRLPAVMDSVIRSLSDMTLPLALIGIGGTLSVNEMRKANRLTMHISLLKLVLFPLLVFAAAFFSGFRGVELGVLVIMLASPTAAAAFVMARNMNANAVLTANAIAVTTLGSLVSTGVYFYVLRIMSLV